MRVEDFDYDLPPELIALRPPARRDGGRLMLVERAAPAPVDRSITDLPGLLPPNCLLVVNQSRVIPARVNARRGTGGRVEVLFLERTSGNADGRQRWSCMIRSSKRLKAGEVLRIEPDAGTGAPDIRILTPPSNGRCDVEIPSATLLGEFGTIPLPPYIRREVEPEDSRRYQTVYADEEGSVAAPTAGLHFTEELLENIQGRGVQVERITLHVGPGTFQPVRCDAVDDHEMESERYEISQETSDAIRQAREGGRPVIAVGTTVVRTLETTRGTAGVGRTRLFIRPGHRFRVVDGLMTNFHLPRSTLLMLVAAFAGHETMVSAYRHAVDEKYRFYSYGDAMLIL